MESLSHVPTRGISLSQFWESTEFSMSRNVKKYDFISCSKKFANEQINFIERAVEGFSLQR